MDKDFKKYLPKKEIKKVTSFRVSHELLDRVNETADQLGVPVCALWEAAMSKALDDLKNTQKKK